MEFHMSTKALAIFWAAYALSLYFKTSSVRREDVELACPDWSRTTYWRAYDELREAGFIHYSKWYVHITPMARERMIDFMEGRVQE